MSFELDLILPSVLRSDGRSSLLLSEVRPVRERERMLSCDSQVYYGEQRWRDCSCMMYRYERLFRLGGILMVPMSPLDSLVQEVKVLAQRDEGSY